jgi:osmotically-inducible protein OsmY
MSQDLSLREDVQRELDWEPAVRAAEIGVSVRDGVVTLSGTVDSYPAKRAAERAAGRVPGVKAVSSQLEVRSTGPGRGDQDIAWAAANVLAWNNLLPPERIRVGVSGGWVTLEGSVDWRFQRTVAEECVAKLTGVRGITNLLDLNPSVPDEELKQQIEQSLKRRAELDTIRIVVETHRDHVTLWGGVGSRAQRELAEQIVWAVPGVSDVSNHLNVGSAVAGGT